MRQIIGAFGVLFVLMINLCLCIAVGVSSVRIANVKQYKADVIAEIENSNFNSNVIAACEQAAQERGYELTVQNCIYDEEQQIETAEILLGYTYEIPFLGITRDNQTRGIAR